MVETQAYYLTKKGNASQAFSLRTCQLPSLNPSQVLIEVEAFGLNYADVMARKGLYKEAPPMPCVLGYEVVGVVKSVGNDFYASLVNQRVVAFCRFGGYAKHVITDATALCVINDMQASTALALATQYVTAYYMVEFASRVGTSDRVLIHAAAGGVGTALIQLCKLKNAYVIAKVSSEAKREFVQKLGADQTIIYTETPYERAISFPIEISFNPVAGSTFKKDWKLLQAGGRLVLFGGSELANGKWGLLSKLNFVKKMGVIIPIGLMMGSKSLMGVNMLKIADAKPEILAQCLSEVVKLTQEGRINPISGGVFSSKELAKAHELLEKGETIGKLTIFWDE